MNLLSFPDYHCEIDGLTWNEVELCEDKFCEMLTITCPTKTDFESFDVNEDGILTIKEFTPV